MQEKDSMLVLQQTSFLDANNASFLESLYESFLQNLNSVSPEWRNYFQQSLRVNNPGSEPLHSVVQQQFKNLARRSPNQTLGQAFGQTRQTNQTTGQAQTPQQNSSRNKVTLTQERTQERKQAKVQALIDAYRMLGHLKADIDPLHLREISLAPELMLSYYGLSDSDLDTVFDTPYLPGPLTRTLRQLIQDLQVIYCGTIATEFMHIPDSPERVWMQEKVENLYGPSNALSKETKLFILKRLAAAEGLEKYLGAKYPGAKRFSLEGLDSFIVALDELVHSGAVSGVKEIVIGMAHRGRLNVLVNVLGKLPSQLFDEFEGKHDEKLESGDVKYHQGFSSDVDVPGVPGGRVHLTLAFNPSHLEIVGPVICGSVRARQDKRNDKERSQVFPIIVHGDAAISGQGVVMETLNMSRTRAFYTGGAVHIIMNNQIGFTTSNPHDARSTLYCSDIGKMMEIPIFHVNADDPEAVFKVTRLALDYRQMFKKDVIIDLIGYRRHGHNEADEPGATQPIMYQIIRKLPTVFQKYGEALVQDNILSKEAAEALYNEYRDLLDKRQAVRNIINNDSSGALAVERQKEWQNYFSQDWRRVIPSVPKATLKQLATALENIPADFVSHPRVQKLMEERRKMTEEILPIDWGYAEILAYATLLNAHCSIRISGQDCSRGTFFHRHAVLHDQKDGKEYCPLAHISETQGRFSIYDSLLSEEAVLAFEYGYSTSDPKTLTIWEAQFGDFVNGAQVVIDQFISSGEHKWGRLSGLTLFLPHGYEGQGPEHSSARLERFLQLCAEHNMQVCWPTTPAQIYHLIRRQMLRPMRKPLVVMTPKSLLRHKLAVSYFEDLTTGNFLPLIREIDNLPAEKVKRVILCSGKIYYELLAKRRELKLDTVSILRIEQLYPFPEVELQTALQEYKQAQDIVWCQEEPQNQGAWYSSQHHIIACLNEHQTLRYVGRKASAAPAVGYAHLHHQQQEDLVKEALW